MDYKKIELHEPIDEIQEKESPKQFYFLDLFYDVDNDNVTNFYKSFDGLQKGDTWVYSGCETTLEFKPFAQSTFRNLVYCLQFKRRRKAHWQNIFDSKKESRKRKITEYMDTFADDVMESTSELKVTENEINYDDSRPHLKAGGKRDIATARKANWDILKDLGDIEDPTKKLDVNAEIDAETRLDNPGLNKIAEAYLNGRKQHNNESTS